VEANFVAFAVDEKGEVAHVVSDVGLWDDKIGASLFGALDMLVNAWHCVQIDNRAIHAWLMHVAMRKNATDAARIVFVALVSWESRHLHAFHGHIVQLGVVDVAVEFFCAIHVRDRNFEPVDCVMCHRFLVI